MPVASAQVLLIAAELREEFREPLAELQAQVNLCSIATLRAASEYLRQASSPPTLIVIAQSRPGEYLHEELDDLVRLAPLARFILLLGSWCEGETRTSKVWSGATRIFWYEWPGELARNLPILSSGRFAPWLAPVTTLEEERYLFEPARVAQAISSGGNFSVPLVLVCTRRSSFGDALCTACQQQGYEALWQRPDRPERVQGVDAIIWEGTQLLPAEVEELQALATQWPQTPIIALADFPRFETQQRAVEAGAVAILPKPCSLADLLGQLNRWCPLPLAEGNTAQAEVA